MITICFSLLFEILNNGSSEHFILRWLDAIKGIGLLALVTGILGQMIGLYDAFSAIEQMGSVAPALLAGGLKVSSITTIWGMICFVVLYFIYLGLSAMVKHK